MSSFPALATPSAQGAFDTIAKTVLGSPAASISFSGISTTNKMFRLTIYIIKDGTTGSADLQLNNDSGGNYDIQRLAGAGTGVTASRSTAQSNIDLSNSNVLANELIVIELTVAKQQTGDEAMIVGLAKRRDGSNLDLYGFAGIWKNTADLINRIDILSSATNFATGTVALLEGNAT